jgi:4'-phosphopantetheinyl transferase
MLPELSPGVVHLWRADLRVAAPTLSALQGVLSKEELQRANRFYFERDRNHFIAGRGILRQLLARYLRQEPAALDFTYTDYGKPELADADNLSFNLSHQSHMALYGFSHNSVIGVDVEQLQPDLDWPGLAGQVFAPDEYQIIKQLPEQQQIPAFFRCWTCKEAFIKTDGRGISLPLREFEVEVDPEKPAKIKAVQWDPDLQKKWDIRAFPVGDRFPGAVVLTEKISAINFYEWC